MEKGIITQEELDRLKAISDELTEMHAKNKAIRFLFCYDKGETSAVSRIGTDNDLANFISGFVHSDDGAKQVVSMVMLREMFGSDDDEHSS